MGGVTLIDEHSGDDFSQQSASELISLFSEISGWLYKITKENPSYNPSTNIFERILDALEPKQEKIKPAEYIKLLISFAQLGKIKSLPLYSESHKQFPGRGKATQDTAKWIDLSAKQILKNMKNFDAKDRINIIYALGIVYPDFITTDFFKVWKTNFLDLFWTQTFKQDINPNKELNGQYTALLHGLTQKMMCPILHLKEDKEHESVKGLIKQFITDLLNSYGGDSTFTCGVDLQRQAQHGALRHQIAQSALVFPQLQPFNCLDQSDAPAINPNLLQHHLFRDLINVFETSEYTILEEYTCPEIKAHIDIAIVIKNSNKPILYIPFAPEDAKFAAIN